MPEVGIKDSPFIQALRTETANKNLYEVSKGKILEIAQGNNEEFIGNGHESIVIQYKGKPTKVIALDYYGMSPERAKSDFYFQRIMSTLFPHNFPHFYAAFSGPELKEGGHIAGTIRERILPPKPTFRRRLMEKLRISDIKYPFTDVEQECFEMGINTGIFNELVPHNFMTGTDGGQYFIDNLEPYMHTINWKDPLTGRPNWDKDRILGYMKDKKYSQVDISIVSSSLDRLRANLNKDRATPSSSGILGSTPAGGTRENGF